MKIRRKTLLFIMSFFCVSSAQSTERSHEESNKPNLPRPTRSFDLGGTGKSRITETMQGAVSVCSISDGEYKQRLANGDIAGVLGEACKMNGAERGSSLKLNEELKSLLSDPVVISEGKLCQKSSIKDTFGLNATTEYKKILEKKLVQHCIKVICKEKDLGKSCNIAPGAVTVPPGLIDKVVGGYGAQLSCKKSDILQVMR